MEPVHRVGAPVWPRKKMLTLLIATKDISEASVLAKRVLS